MYTKVMTATQISEIVEDIYGFEISGGGDGMVSNITESFAN